MIYNNVQLQLTPQETAEYARLRTRFFGNTTSLTVTAETQADPDFQRYIILNKKMQVMYRFWKRLNNAPPTVYIRVQRWVERTSNGSWIQGFSPAYGLVLDTHHFYPRRKTSSR